MIKQHVVDGVIEIDPYVEANVQPASIDLTLGREVRVYKHFCTDPGASHVGMNVVPRGGYIFMDPKREQETHGLKIADEGFVINPGVLYLMHTAERIRTDKFVSVLDGKSSIGRMGVVVHLTAGYGDPGFDGQYTLEVTCVHPVKLYPGMKIAQMRFHTVLGELDSYADKGHYTGAEATGARPSMAHKQFEETE
jgi:dCTP deaminase